MTFYHKDRAIMRVPAHNLRCWPTDTTHRVTVDAYALYPDRLPNGTPRLPRVVSCASVTVGGAFRLTTRFVRHAGRLALEIDTHGIDLVRQERTLFVVSPALKIAIHDAMNCAHVAEMARTHARTAGRN